MTGPVHFIYLGGPFEWQHWRAVETAKVHGTQIIVWADTQPTYGAPVEAYREHWDALDRSVRYGKIELPDWLRDHPIGLANVKDLYAWRILHEHGGLYLDLDTISLHPVWDLLTRDVLVSTEWPDLSDPIALHPYNSAVVAARKDAPVLDVLADWALKRLTARWAAWGSCGPHLLTQVVEDFPEAFDAAPFGVLNGWRDDTIHEYYDGARPGPDVRVVHLYSSSRPERFLADRWMPTDG